MLALAFCCSYDVKIHYVRQIITVLLQTHIIPEVLPRNRVITRSLLRFIFRPISISNGCLSAAHIRVILCRSSLNRWLFKYRTLSFVVRI
ncbi:hypothetical protein HanHA89_Chr14g0592721 [Helianthus annuus]|nr:hypothetical protein HanHA89_Chr14g0592721 [Helianthus annuus]